jgi:hypothetical protein
VKEASYILSVSRERFPCPAYSEPILPFHVRMGIDLSCLSDAMVHIFGCGGEDTSVLELDEMS